MEKEIVNEVQEAQRVPYRIRPRRNTPRHMLIKLTKTKHKKRILKAAREKQQFTYKGNTIRLTVDFSAETLNTKRECQVILIILKGKKNLQPRLLKLARISLKINGEIISFTDKQKLRECTITKITADGVCSHEIKRCLLFGRKVMTNLDSIFKTRDITLSTKVHLVKAMIFPAVMYGCESWTIKKAEH